MSSGNHSRLTSLTYPNGSAISYVYGSSLDLDDTISRLTSITSGSTTLEEYAYLGLDTVVKRTHPRFGNDIGLTYVKQSGEGNSDAGDPYTGLDRFGRVVDQRWIKSNDVSNPLDRFQYGYDRNSSRMYRDNLISNSFDELYHTDSPTAGYDTFNQLTDFQRGALSDSNSDNVPDTSSDSHSQSWDLDSMGNWESLSTDGGTAVDREHNKQNQVTSVGSDDLDFDDNGNTTTDETGNTLVYDAWNRLVQVLDGTTVLVSYAYDALGRRVQESESDSDFYYSDKWQVLEDRVSGSAHAQYVWSPVYVDALIVRDRDADSSSGNGLEERLYVLQDANWNVTAIANAAGTVQERYVYDPYGTPTRLTASWGTPSSDQYSWVYLFQGSKYDSAANAYTFRYRDASPTLGRWLQMDPIRYDAGDTNLFRSLRSNPASLIDPLGLCSEPTPIHIDVVPTGGCGKKGRPGERDPGMAATRELYPDALQPGNVEEMVTQIEAELDRRSKLAGKPTCISTLNIRCHGDSGRIVIGADDIGGNIDPKSPFYNPAVVKLLKRLNGRFCPDKRILKPEVNLWACSVAGTERGREFLKQLAEILGVRVGGPSVPPDEWLATFGCKGDWWVAKPPKKSPQ